MEQAIRRLDAALAQRAEVFRRLSEQHGLMAGDLKALRDDLQAARDEADGLRERAALVDALRAELAQFQIAAETAPETAPADDASAAHAAELAARDNEIAVLKAEIAHLQASLEVPDDLQDLEIVSSAIEFSKEMPEAARDDEIAALKAEVTAAKASQTEMQAFQSGIAARLEATMARLRQALDSQAQH
jgi:hypothetical protein